MHAVLLSLSSLPQSEQLTRISQCLLLLTFDFDPDPDPDPDPELDNYFAQSSEEEAAMMKQTVYDMFDSHFSYSKYIYLYN